MRTQQAARVRAFECKRRWTIYSPKSGASRTARERLSHQEVPAMDRLLVAALVLNFVAETLAAATLIGGPSGVGATEASNGGRWSMHYGFAVIAIASAGAWVWPRRRELAALTPVLGILATFHVAVLTSLLIAGDQPVGVVIHAVLSLTFLLLLLLRGRIVAR
jgi:hypothetical protein